jgi:uncharacterized protein
MPVEQRLRIPVSEGFFELEGELILPDGSNAPVAAIVVCHPHPLYGGDMHNEVVQTLCRAALDRGIAALRFNFRGTGHSGGEHGGGYEEREDVFAALDLLRGRHEQIDPARLGLAGYSFGAAVALNAAPAAGVRALCAVSPPPQMLDFTAQWGVDLPVLLIAGDEDPIAPAARVQQLPAAIGPRARAEIVAGADHFWWGHMTQLADLAGDFFAAALAAV